MAHAHLWSSLRQCSAFCGHMEQESPLPAHPETMVSCLSAGPDFSLDSFPASCGTLAPFRLFLWSQPQSSPLVWPTKPKPQLSPTLVCEQSVSGWWVLVGTDPLCENLSAVLSVPLLLCSPLWFWILPPAHPQSPPVKLLPSLWNLFLLRSSLPEVQVSSLFFWLCFFLFSFALPRYVGIFLPFGKSEVFC